MATRGVFGWLGVFVVAFSLTGCGPSNEVAPKPAPVKSEPGKSVAAPAPEKTTVKAPVAAKEPEVKLGPMMTADQKDITLRWVENGKTSMAAKAAKFEGSQSTKTGVLVDFSAELFENGKLTTTMTAPRVIANANDRSITATGGVVLKSIDKSTVIKAGWIKWTSTNSKVVGNGGVKVTSNMGGKDHYDMEGAAFVADTSLQTLTVKNSGKGMTY